MRIQCTIEIDSAITFSKILEICSIIFFKSILKWNIFSDLRHCAILHRNTF